MRTWQIRLNGAPLMRITAPSWMNPAQVAREVLLHHIPDGVTVEWDVPASRKRPV